ncbi:MAG: FIST C-terminal domain-containing protein [Gemmatimonadaceae bacterium]|nr:FIST C-terminal domain-containing protein [Gemmatimonadaceae bacterium]MBA3645889.1 FIST C-terminal domain-containing protein [Gemmatimonadaceae bacterium]
MTDIAIASTDKLNGDAGDFLGSEIRKQLKGAPDALIVFAAPENNYSELLQSLSTSAGTKTIVGCSSAGEFTNSGSGNGLTCAIALRSPQMRFAATLGRNLSDDRKAAADQMSSNFSGLKSSEFKHRAAIVFIDALAGHSDDLIDQLTTCTAGTYRFVGGGAGDNARFEKTHVFCGTEAFSNAAVAMEILSQKPLGIGARHGWTPASEPLRVTDSDVASVRTFNIAPAVEAFQDHAAATDQEFDANNPLPFFLHNIVGVKTESGHKLRVPLGVSDGGGVITAAEVPSGSTACIMSTGSDSAAKAAADATRDAMKQVEDNGDTPRAALFFDCVATRLRLGSDFDNELDAVGKELHGIPFAGFNSYGQIVRSQGQFSGFHNCTAVACVFPD